MRQIFLYLDRSPIYLTKKLQFSLHREKSFLWPGYCAGADFFPLTTCGSMRGGWQTRFGTARSHRCRNFGPFLANFQKFAENSTKVLHTLKYNKKDAPRRQLSGKIYFLKIRQEMAEFWQKVSFYLLKQGGIPVKVKAARWCLFWQTFFASYQKMIVTKVVRNGVGIPNLVSVCPYLKR